jgi:hypothetical protein
VRPLKEKRKKEEKKKRCGQLKSEPSANDDTI